MNKKAKWIVILIVAIAVCVGAGSYAIITARSKAAQEAAYEDLRQEVEVSLEDVEAADYDERDGDAPETPDVLVEGENPINFEKLQAINSDLVGWIRVPNTNIDYPVARYDGEDQSYYLSHNMYKEAQFAGCIYMENKNSGDFSDNNTVLYGHNMKNKSMFANLHLFEDRDFFDENKYIYVYTPEGVNTYEIFAAYKTDDTDLHKAFDFSNDAVYEAYISSVLSTKESETDHLREETAVSADKKMITLSTCVAGQKSNRYVVQGVLVEDVTAE